MGLELFRLEDHLIVLIFQKRKKKLFGSEGVARVKGSER